MAASPWWDHAGGMTQNPTHDAPPQGTSFLDDMFTRLRGSGYYRDTDSRWFGGVCSGLAQRFGVDPVLIRAAAVVLVFLGGLGITLYVVLWLLLPDRRGDVLAERAALLVIGGVFSIGQGNGWFAPLWLIPVAVIAWLIISRDRSRQGIAPGAFDPGVQPSYGPVPPGTPPPPPSFGDSAMSAPPMNPAPAALPTTGSYAAPQAGPYAGPYAGAQGPYGQSGPYGGSPAGPYGGRPVPPAPRPVAPPPPRPPRRPASAFVGLVSLGLALVGIGLGAGLDDPIGFPGTSATLGFLIGLVGVSLVVLALGMSGRASGFSGFLAVVLGLLLVGSSATSQVAMDVDGGVGDRIWVPTATSTQTTYELGAGDATLDLTQLSQADLGSIPQRLAVEMGAGDLRILIPADLTTTVNAEVGVGSIRRVGVGGGETTEDAGPARNVTTTVGDGPVQVVVDAELGFGSITIQEQS